MIDFKDMNKKISLLVIFLFIIMILLAWSPWLNNEKIYQETYDERADIDGTIDPYTGSLVCDYSVTWVPFGRKISSCEAVYFVTFFGHRL